MNFFSTRLRLSPPVRILLLFVIIGIILGFRLIWYTDAIYLKQMATGMNIDDRAQLFSQNTKDELEKRLKMIWERDHVGFYIRTSDSKLRDSDFFPYVKTSRLLYSDIRILSLHKDPQSGVCSIYLVTPKSGGRRHRSIVIHRHPMGSYNHSIIGSEVQLFLALSQYQNSTKNQPVTKIAKDVDAAFPAFLGISGGIAVIIVGTYFVTLRLARKKTRSELPGGRESN